MKAQVQRVAGSATASFVFRAKSDARFARGWHCHPEIELTYIVRSRGTRVVGAEIAGYTSGELVLLGSGLPHTWISAETGERHRAIVVQFHRAFLGAELWQRPEMAPIAALLDSASRGIEFSGETRRSVAGILATMSDQDGFARVLSLLGALRYLAEAPRGERRFILKSAEPSFPRAAKDQRTIERALRTIEDHYTEQLSQRDVADTLEMTPASFSRFFKRWMGTTFVAHLSELRIAHACRLLVESERSVVAIALESGFNNLSNFNRRFRELRGMPPRDYRAKHRATWHE